MLIHLPLWPLFGFNAVLGVFQNIMGKVFNEIKKLAAPYSMVICGGETVKIPYRELVAGDIVLIRGGG
jgi:magnesium-transporting ATPase (P-type)